MGDKDNTEMEVEEGVNTVNNRHTGSSTDNSSTVNRINNMGSSNMDSSNMVNRVCTVNSSHTGSRTCITDSSSRTARLHRRRKQVHMPATRVLTLLVNSAHHATS